MLPLWEDGGKRCCTLASERRVLAPPLSDKPDLLLMYHFGLALVGEVFLGPRRRPRGPRPVYQQIPAVRHGIFCFSGISLTNYRYYIQTVKYKSKETLFGGKIKCFLRKVLS